MRVLDIGCGTGERGECAFPNAEVVGLDLVDGWDVTQDGLPSGWWDVLFCHHLVEHLVDVDRFLDMCADVMVPGHTRLIIGMPNLAAWFNRLTFLFGYLPHSMELSTRYQVGKPFGWNQEALGGHVRVFTVPAFCQLLRHHGFEMVSVRGEASTYPAGWLIGLIDRVATRWSPTMASAFTVEVKR